MVMSIINEMNEKYFKNNATDTPHPNNQHKQHHHSWVKLRLLKKCEFCRNYKSQHQMINSILQSKYLLSNNYYYLNTLSQILKHPSLVPSLSFEQPIQHIKHYYSLQSIPTQLPDIIEYYKYYGQKPILFINTFFSILSGYHQHKKIIEYNRLKLLLSLEPTESGNCSLFKPKPNHNNNFNILDEINNESHDEQSVMVVRLRDKLSKYLSNTKPLTIQQIDNDFNSSSHPLRNAIYEDKTHKHSKKTIKSTVSNQQNKHKKCNHSSKHSIDKSKHKLNLKSQQSVSSHNYLSLTKKNKIPPQIRSTIIQFKNKIRKEKRKLIKSFGTSQILWKSKN